MLTKAEFANQIVDEFCRENNVQRSDAHAHIYESSRLAVALEYLGKLNECEWQYSMTRGGTEYSHVVLDDNGKFKDLHILSTRELIRMLPMEIYNENLG